IRFHVVSYLRYFEDGLNISFMLEFFAIVPLLLAAPSGLMSSSSPRYCMSKEYWLLEDICHGVLGL
ncbi:hypothetical protein N9V90_00005, partial [Endozoicomonas sp.]|nr:hypothetical protein [Endozoicomonas sp.]